MIAAFKAGKDSWKEAPDEVSEEVRDLERQKDADPSDIPHQEGDVTVKVIRKKTTTSRQATEEAKRAISEKKREHQFTPEEDHYHTSESYYSESSHERDDEEEADEERRKRSQKIQKDVTTKDGIEKGRKTIRRPSKYLSYSLKGKIAPLNKRF